MEGKNSIGNLFELLYYYSEILLSFSGPELNNAVVGDHTLYYVCMYQAQEGNLTWLGRHPFNPPGTNLLTGEEKTPNIANKLQRMGISF